jgi:hypothetical protein
MYRYSKWKPLLLWRETIEELHVQMLGLNTAELREGGVLQGEGQGIITTKDGQGMATWTGPGIGRITGPGKVSFRGSLFFRIPSTSEGGKLSYLNNMMGVFEYEVDELGNCSVKTWEWK